jgi:hypothetical protein
MRAQLISTLVIAAATACRSAETRPPATAPAKPATSTASTALESRHLGTPDWLPEAARDLINERMQDHGREMSILMWSILFLDDEGTKEVSRVIGSAPMIARPLPGPDQTMNAALPKQFFALQDALAEKAKRLAQVASSQTRTSKEIAQAFGELTATCVECHSVYLYERPEAVGPGASEASEDRGSSRSR